MEFRTENSPGIMDKNLEEREQLNEYWKNKEIKSFSFRRHSEWGYGTEEYKGLDLGFLTKEGYKMADERAVSWGNKMKVLNEKLNGEVEFSIQQSPSFIPSFNPEHLEDGTENPEYDARFPKEIKPKRAEMTGFSYEERIFGGLAPSKTEPILESKQLRTNSRSKRLGDFMENVSCKDESQLGRLIGEFHQLKGELYPDPEEFWIAFIKNELPSELLDALKACNGSTSLDLTRNMIDFISDKKEKTTEEKKEIILAVTHGETMDSFLHFLGKFLEEKKDMKNHGLDEILFDYNEGFDAHIDFDENLVVSFDVEKVEDEKESLSVKTIKVKLNEFEDYINNQKGFISTEPKDN